jgi:CRISPR-associated endonuclease/helicase Cas3
MTTSESAFSNWFKNTTGHSPYPYQVRLAVDEWPIVIDIPTGLGKTAAIVLAWLWRRKYSEDKDLRAKTPRRLAYVLPMRTLVDQISREIEKWVAASGNKIDVYRLMGGAISKDWDRDPTADCIIVATQDMILSRCLNRPYGNSKYKAPIHFGLLNQDCLFVMDETQLMPGLRTAAQLQGLRDRWKTYGPTQTVFMSATLSSELLTTVDYKPDLTKLLALNDDDKKKLTVIQRLEAKKQLQRFPIACPTKEKDETKYIKSLAEQVDAAFQATGSKGLVLVICNRVRRAQALYDLLKLKENRLLVHSRFRVGDRAELNQKLLSENLSGIVVATQTVEAGVDISAQYLFTELSPWSSFVQRVGRCNRKGEFAEGEAIVHWIDFEDLSDEAIRPYESNELEQTRILLQQLEQAGKGVGPEALDEFRKGPDIKLPAPKLEGMIPRQHDLMQLFDTSADLSGHEIDISCFIRDAQNMDVAIAWRNWTGDQPPSDFSALHRDELCQVSIGKAKAFLKKATGYVRDRVMKLWNPVDERSIYPGQTILVNCQSGGYSEILGFTGDPKHKPQPIPTEIISPEEDDSDGLSSLDQYVSLTKHSDEIVEELHEFIKCLQLDEGFSDLPVAELKRAARWHDAGKAHEAFQNMLTRRNEEKKQEDIWAKSDQTSEYKYPDDRRGFRHELASALWALQHETEFLIPYLVASHHGKVRMTIQPRPNEQPPRDGQRYALGVHDNDPLPEVDLGDGLLIPATNISLACMELGGTLTVKENDDGTIDLVGMRSWTEQAIELLEAYGPFRLAFLEALIRTADWKASAKYNKQNAYWGD